MEYDTIRAHVIDLGPVHEGFTVQIDCNEFDVYINARLSADALCRAWDHEMEHINRRDFAHFLTVDQLEARMAEAV